MRVVILGKWPGGEPLGGVAVHTVNLVRCLGKLNGLDLYVVSFGDESKVLTEGRAKIILIQAKKIHYVFPILALIRLALEIRKIRPDIIHVQGSNISPYLLYTLFLATRKCRKIITVHGIMRIEAAFKKGMKANITMVISKPLEKYAVSKIPDIIACSPAMKSVLTNLTNSEIHVIPNGVDFENIQNIQPYKSIKHPSILFVGLLRKVKGVELLLKAIPIILKSLPEVHVYIAGSGEQEIELKRLVKELSIEEQVKFLGFISKEEKFAYYKSADICVVPSIYEAFGIVLLESMACGKPTVASNVGGIPFIVEDGKTGLLFECGDVRDLAEKIITLLQNKELREKMGEAGKDRAREFTWTVAARKTYDLYTKLAGSD